MAYIHSLGSSLAIDAFTETYKTTPTIYFYCSYGELERREAAPVLATLLKQLSMRSENMDPQVVAVFDKGLSMSMEPSAKSLRAAFSRFEQTFIVVDALDECSKDERKLLVSFFTGLIRSNPHGIKILLTSRPESDLEHLLKGSSKFLINANDTTKDIRPYVAAVLTEHIANCAILDGMVKPELQQRLIDTISDQADGMFLWAKLQLDHICKEPNEKAIIAQLGKLPLGLDNSYDRIWKGITGPSSTVNERKYAFRTLKWVLHAKRPLSPQEILEATALEVDPQSSGSPQPASSPDYLIRVCGNFIALDVQTNGFRFIHYSVQEFLKDIPDLRDDNILANACLTVLGVTDTEHGKQNLNIYEYASHNWEKHCDSWNTIDEHRAILIQGFLLNALAFADWQRHRGLQQGFRSAGYYRLLSHFNLPILLEHLLQHGQHQTHQPELSAALIIAADRGYLVVVQLLLRAGVNPNSRGGWCGSPLQAASYRGFGDVVKLLLQADIDIDATGGYYGSALGAAIATHSEPLVQQLLDSGANANSHCEYDVPVLLAAVFQGSQRMVDMLITAGADIDAQSGGFSSALYTAARAGNTNIVQLLLDGGATVNALSGKHNGSALYIASGKGQCKVVEQLLAAKADPNIEGGKYGFALCYATRGGHSRVAEQLLTAKADPNIAGGEYGSALSYAASGGHSRIVTLLLGASADVNREVRSRHPVALCAAISRRSVECVDILISAGASVQTTNWTYPLHRAVSCGYEELVDKLLDSRSDPNSRSLSSGLAYELPLSLAAAAGFEMIVGSLIRAGAKPNKIDNDHTALLLAVKYGTDIMVEVLLAGGADPNNPLTSPTPLAAAVERQSELTIKRLLAVGADINDAGILLLAVSGKNISVVNLLLEAGADVNLECADGSSPLFNAVRWGSLDMIATLLSAGADIHYLEGDPYPQSAFTFAAQRGDLDIMEVLLKVDADINTVVALGPALQCAIEWGEDDIFRVLLKAGADVNARGNTGLTALQLACSIGRGWALPLLLQAGAEVNLLGGKGGSILQQAVLYCPKGCVELLLNAGADVNLAGGKYGSALQAAAYSNPRVVERLLMAGADVNALGGMYGSALQAAACNSDLEIMRLLLSAGADPNAVSGPRGSALQAAAHWGHEKAVELLLKAGANVNSRGGRHGSALQDTTDKECRALLLSWGAIDDDLVDSDSE